MVYQKASQCEAYFNFKENFDFNWASRSRRIYLDFLYRYFEGYQRYKKR